MATQQFHHGSHRRRRPRGLLRRIPFSVVVLNAIVFAAFNFGQGLSTMAQQDNTPTLKVHRCDDFDVTGDGSNNAWDQAKWQTLNCRQPVDQAYKSRFKMLYSDSGVYVLFEGEDQQLSASTEEDFADLWLEDVFECFFWTDERDPVYFEYEISPLGFELPILIPNLEGQFLGWRPWHYEGDRKTSKATSVVGGEKASMAKIDRWTAEVFIPYKLLSPLRNVPPKPGDTWRANFYRMDYDSDKPMAWDWARTGDSFHEFKKFGTIEFVE